MISTFDLGATNHTALVGFDLAYQDTTFLRYRENLPNMSITVDPQVRFTPAAGPADGADAWQQPLGRSVLRPGPDLEMLRDGRLKLLVGGRYDASKGEGSRNGMVQRHPTEAAKFTGRFGAGYSVVPSTLAFASVSQSFRPQFAGTVDIDGRLLDPQTGLQYEGGFKFELFEGRFLTTASVYHIRKDNVPAFNFPLFLETGAITYFPGVAERSRGVEFDLAGRLTDGLSVMVNYAFNDAETIENTADPFGGRAATRQHAGPHIPYLAGVRRTGGPAAGRLRVRCGRPRAGRAARAVRHAGARRLHGGRPGPLVSRARQRGAAPAVPGERRQPARPGVLTCGPATARSCIRDRRWRAIGSIGYEF